MELIYIMDTYLSYLFILFIYSNQYPNSVDTTNHLPRPLEQTQVCQQLTDQPTRGHFLHKSTFKTSTNKCSTKYTPSM